MTDKVKLTTIIAIVILTIFGVCMSGCIGNKDLIGTQYNFNWAVIKLPSGEIIEGKVTQWRRGGEDGQVRVTIDGISYNTSLENVCLMSEKLKGESEND